MLVLEKFFEPKKCHLYGISGSVKPCPFPEEQSLDAIDMDLVPAGSRNIQL
jgi:hypothetical protein